MDFEDRLKNHLQNQSNEVHIEPATVGDIADRSAARRQRRLAGSAMAVAVVVLGIGGFIVGNDGDSPVRIGDDFAAESNEGTEGEQQGEQPGGEVQEILTGPLVFEDIADDDSPGGFGIYDTVVGSNGVYYVLSTSHDDYDDHDAQSFEAGTETLHRYDGTWQNSSFEGRVVSDFGQVGDLLYALSTGSPDGNEGAVGTSADGGETWKWTTLALPDRFGDAISLSGATFDGKLLVIARSDTFPDFEMARQLAIDAGAAIDPDIHEIIDVNAAGISWYEVPENEACYREMDRLYEENGSFDVEPVPFPLADEDYSYNDLSAEERAAIDAWQKDSADFWADEQQRITALLANVAGCERFGECLGESQIREREIAESAPHPEGDDTDWEAFEAEQARLYEPFHAWLDESGCGEVLNFSGPVDVGFEFDSRAEPVVVEELPVEDFFVSWDELGVVVPESWIPMNEGFVLVDGELTNLGRLFGDELGYLVRLSAEDNGFVVAFDSIAAHMSAGAAEPAMTTYRSVDGATWENLGPMPLRWVPPAVHNGAVFAIDWNNRGDDAQFDSPVLVRNGESFTAQDLAGDSGIDTTNVHLNQVHAGEYGIVVLATRWEEPNADAMAVSPGIDAIVFFSRDGINWAPTELEGVDAFNVAVGADSVMVFAGDPTVTGDRANAHPVLLGRAS